jgi:hypothetical protein
LISDVDEIRGLGSTIYRAKVAKNVWGSAANNKPRQILIRTGFGWESRIGCQVGLDLGISSLYCFSTSGWRKKKIGWGGLGRSQSGAELETGRAVGCEGREREES